MAIALSLSCGPTARLAEPPAAPSPWCVAVEGLHDGVAHAGRICADDPTLCGYLRERAVALSGIAGLTAVGACRGGR